MSTTFDDAELAKRLREVLRVKGTSIRDISEKLEMPYRTVQNYLAGETKIPAVFVFRFCHLVDVEIDFILYGDFRPHYGDMASAVFEALDRCGSIDGFLRGPTGNSQKTPGADWLSLQWRVAAVVIEEYDAARRERMAAKKKLNDLPFGKRDHSSDI